MKLLDYLKDKTFTILIFLIETLLITIILNIFNINIYLIIIITILNLITGLFILIYNYLRKYQFYNQLFNNLSKLDKKYYIIETIKSPHTYEEKLITNILYDINKSMIENIKEKEEGLINFKEFVELWIHEVKIPISSLILFCHNHKDIYHDEFTSIVRKLDNYVDQVLYYVRSEESEKDFVISEVNLKDTVKNVILKNKDDFLMNNITIEANTDNLKVSTDAKWLEYILNQIISNSIKYQKEDNSYIKIETKKENNQIILSIYDNGIGIPKKDLPNIYKKSFTGTNGRNKVKSTGMGLYIVNNLINKLGHNIIVESKINEYTKVSIIFNLNDYYKM